MKIKQWLRNFLKKDILDLTENDLKDYDVVITAFGAWTEDTLHLHKTTVEQEVCTLMKV